MSHNVVSLNKVNTISTTFSKSTRPRPNISHPSTSIIPALPSPSPSLYEYNNTRASPLHLSSHQIHLTSTSHHNLPSSPHSRHPSVPEACHHHRRRRLSPSHKKLGFPRGRTKKSFAHAPSLAHRRQLHHRAPRPISQSPRHASKATT